MNAILVKFAFTPTDRTDVLCIACNKFHADLVVVRNDGAAADIGIHAKCVKDVRYKQKRQSGAQ